MQGVGLMNLSELHRILAILPVPENHEPWEWEPWRLQLGSIEHDIPTVLISGFSATEEITGFGVRSGAPITLADISCNASDAALIALAHARLDAALASMNKKYGLRKP
jgi:hypothetical protein